MERETRVFKGMVNSKTVYFPQFKLNACWINYKGKEFDTDEEAKNFLNTIKNGI